MTCRCCGNDRQNRGHGLCWRCWSTPGVRDIYGPVNDCGRRGIANGHRNGTMPEPTTIPPGTPGKLAVLEGRARRGEQLFHPADAKW